MSEIGVVIVEDNKFVREAWTAVVDADEAMKVSGTFASCEEALASAVIEDADVVLMDIGLPGMSGIDGVRQLQMRRPRLPVIMCTVFEDDDNLFNALRAGAVGYVLKKTPAGEIVGAIREAVAGGSPMTPAIARKVIHSFHLETGNKNQSADSPLTPREREVLELLVQGKTYHAIADELFISIDGVRYHLRHIYEKLQVSSRGEAVAKGIKDRIVHPPR